MKLLGLASQAIAVACLAGIVGSVRLVEPAVHVTLITIELGLIARVALIRLPGLSASVL